MPQTFCDVYFLDVGQGHATLFTDGEFALLVDCPFSGSSAVLDLMLEIVSQVQFRAIVSHRDLDHCGGIRAIMQERPFDVLYINPAWNIPKSGSIGSRVRSVIEGIIDQAELDGTRCEAATEGMGARVGPVQWDVISPPHTWVLKASLDDTTNRTSIVIMATVFGHRILLPGDADKVALDRIVGSNHDLTADVLLVPHHGGDIAGLEDFVKAVAPEVAIISAGRSAGIHPTLGTLAILSASVGCRTMCTQVAPSCHSLPLNHSACAGTVACHVTHGGIEIEPDGAAHRSRIATLESAKCDPT